MSPRVLVFGAGFACGALMFIALQSFGQSDVQCRDGLCAAHGAAPELPALGEAPEKDRKKEKEKSLLIPLGATIGMIGVLSLWGKNSSMPCAQYPCAHYGHVGTGAAIGYLFTSYYSPGSAIGVGLAVSLGKEIMDKQNGKSFSRTDVATRLLGTGLGIYIAKTF